MSATTAVNENTRSMMERNVSMDKTSALEMERQADMEAYKTIGSPLVKDAKMRGM